MKLLIQRVSKAVVAIAGKEQAAIGKGVVLFVAVEKGDTVEEAGKLATKLLKFRIFDDDRGRMNRTIEEVKGEILVVSEFTLAADSSKGTRPSFDRAELPERAKVRIEELVQFLKMSGLTVREGVFGGEMDVSLTNAGPVTFLLEQKATGGR